MRIQLNNVLVFIALLSFVFTPCSGEALPEVSEHLRDVEEAVKNFISSFLVKDALAKNMSPSTIIGLCIAAVILAILFRGLIFFVIMFGVLIMMFGNTEKAADYLKERFNFVKVKPDNQKGKN